MKKGILFACFFVICSTCFANTNDLYQIEVLAFVNKKNSKQSMEKWPSYIGKLNLKNSVQIKSVKYDENLDNNSHINNLETLTPIKRSKFSLNSAACKIEKNLEKDLLYHNAWSQKLFLGRKPLSVYLHTVDVEEGPCEDNYPFSGIIKVKKLRGFFHVNVDFIYISKKSIDGINSFRLTSKARIKNNETYYFDHPIFGVLVFIKKI